MSTVLFIAPKHKTQCTAMDIYDFIFPKMLNVHKSHHINTQSTHLYITHPSLYSPVKAGYQYSGNSAIAHNVLRFSPIDTPPN